MLETKNILIEERKKRNLTQREIADMLNISQSAYAKYENGQATPTTESIKILAKYYRLSADYLLGLKQ